MAIMQPREVLEKLTEFPIRIFEEGDVVLAEGRNTGRLLFLNKGAVDIVIEDVFIVRATDPGSVFGDMSFLLGQPHTAAVLAAQPSSFHIVDDPKSFLEAEPEVALYVAAVLAQRLDAVNRLLVEAKRQAEAAGERRGLLGDTLDRMVRALHIRTPA